MEEKALLPLMLLLAFSSNHLTIPMKISQVTYYLFLIDRFFLFVCVCKNLANKFTK